MHKLLQFFWSDWRIGVAGAAGLAAGAGLISAWLTPRGPATTTQALATMGEPAAFAALMAEIQEETYGEHYA